MMKSLQRLRILLLGAAVVFLTTTAAWAGRTTPSETHWSSGYDDDDLSWVLVSGDLSSSSGSGQTEDFEEARRIARRDGELLWVRDGDSRYVIRDRALIGRARDALEPSEMLGREQGRLGRKQGELGRRQGELGRRQGELGRRQGPLGTEQARLNLRIQSAEDRGISTRPMEARLSEIEREMDGLGREMDELGRLQEELSRQQEPLGRKQEEMGRQQEKYAKEMRATMRELIQTAIREGKAESVR